MHDNEVLRTIRGRRSVIRFTEQSVTDDELAAILEAGRWAPSYINSQPWEFLVVRDAKTRVRLGEILRRITVAWQGFAAAPVSIVVMADPARDPRHLAEDGAAAVQNMCLAAHSLGLATFWAGLHAMPETRGTAESDLKAALGIPAVMQLIAVVPVGHPAYVATTSRRPVSEIVHLETYGKLMSERAG
jgi:nitroreductase